ncbi:MAG: tRNA uridine-5-carboxymethylaminomethyl(34) synthesis GTPase MnmE [Lachnospiraceae bacterium]|nr:tRNA uridine-5-carboxymethylaminomethyl(34) synthesis GTPase MnmE [Lachnospiraceae bacterium]
MRIQTENDTITAIATALSPSGIGIVRISGPEAVNVASRVFCAGAAQRTDVSAYESHTVHYGRIADPESGRIIDEVMLLVMRAPRTYTREDTVEIDCHGGVLVTKRVLEAVLHAGVRLAEPGEFTKRAYLNGRIDLSQAEAVAGIISAKNDLALRNSVRQLGGRERAEITEIRGELLREIAQIEATLDDPEHLSFDGFDEMMRKNTASQSARICRLLATADDGRRIKEGIRTVIVGRPNAGKSSLLNALLQEDRAIVTEIAGTTRDTLTEEVNLRGITLLLVDTAGIRESTDVVEALGVARAKEAAASADLILYVADSSAPIDPADRLILASCKGKPMIPLLNKSDLPPAVSAAEIGALVDESMGEGQYACESKRGDVDGHREANTATNPIMISAKTGEGIEALEERITEMFFAERLRADEECLITSERHKQELIAARDSLARVQESIDAGMSEDFYTIDLTAAYEALGRILGEEPDEDVINAIFAEFCLGK